MKESGQWPEDRWGRFNIQTIGFPNRNPSKATEQVTKTVIAKIKKRLETTHDKNTPYAWEYWPRRINTRCIMGKCLDYTENRQTHLWARGQKGQVTYEKNKVKFDQSLTAMIFTRRK